MSASATGRHHGSSTGLVNRDQWKSHTGNGDDHNTPDPGLVPDHLPQVHHQAYRENGARGDGHTGDRVIGVPILDIAMETGRSLEQRHLGFQYVFGGLVYCASCYVFGFSGTRSRGCLGLFLWSLPAQFKERQEDVVNRIRSRLDGQTNREEQKPIKSSTEGQDMANTCMGQQKGKSEKGRCIGVGTWRFLIHDHHRSGSARGRR